MKEILKTLREFPTLAEDLRSGHLFRHGTGLTTNALTFPDIPYDGAVILADSGTYHGLVSLKDTSDEAMAAFVAFDIIMAAKMEKNYNYVDEVANGSSVIVAKAGLNSSSSNTARVGIPGDFSNLKYSFTRFPNQIKVEWRADDLAYGALVFTSSEPTVSLTQSGPSQLKLTIGLIIIFIDITTKSSVIVDHLTGGSSVKSKAVLFNTNGLNPLVNMQAVVVPQAME